MNISPFLAWIINEISQRTSKLPDQVPRNISYHAGIVWGLRMAKSRFEQLEKVKEKAND